MKKLTIIEALDNRKLFGLLPAFQRRESWSAWRVFLKAVYGLPLDSGELAIFQKHTGRTVYDRPVGGFPEVACIVGRQSGKTRIAALIATYEAIVAPPEADRTETYALMLSQDHRAAMRALLGYAKSPFEVVRVLKDEVFSVTADTVRLANGVSICAYPCRPASIRGLRARVVVLDELAHFRSTENVPTDTEMLRAVRPCLATTNGKLIILSSPYAPSGALWDLHRQHYGRNDSSTLVWQASAPEMNPTLPKDYLERMAQDDPEAYRSEVLGEFRAGLSTFIDPAVIQDCIDTGVRERLPQEGVRHFAHCDSASGNSSGKDAFTAGIAHRDGERIILDVVRGWKPPFNPSGVIAEVADLLKQYKISYVEGDRYAPGFVSEHFRTHGIEYRYSKHDRSELYLEMLPLLNAGSVVLLDHPELLRELRGLERRRGTSGRDRIDHRPGSHDDFAVSAAGAIVAASAPALAPLVCIL